MVATRIVLVSACLTGLRTRYDGRSKTSTTCLQRLEGAIWLPVCPEQLGGLPTPRCAANLIGGDGADVLRGRAAVICTDGNDVTHQFIIGAEQVLAIARSQPVSSIYLKARSPSCGISTLGVTAALLAENGFVLEEFE
ncbi:MAG: DUF523 domain-containing protein [Desulfofustis sp.]|jgi:uncharacterized protein YbbK (DUF523 family)|nr:DUF523 domain-containing protein [Desulfofustis sp.]